MTPTTNSRKARLSIAAPARRQTAQHGIEHAPPKSCYSSSELFSGKREIQILHNEQAYRLTITKLGKLILTK